MHSTFYPNLKLSALVISINTALFMSVSAQAATGTQTELEKELGYEPTTTLEPIILKTEAESADGPVNGLAATRVSTSTGKDESILKSIQSVTIVGQQEIQSIAASNLMDAMNYSAGINTSDGFDRTSEYYMLRGFLGIGSYRNGLKYHVNGYNGQQELYGLDRLEVVKGPASVLSGTLPPGGTLNAISKKPFFDNAYEVNAEVGNFNRKQISTDLNHKVNDDIAVRLIGVYRDSDTFVDFVPDDRSYIAPSLTWQPNSDTKVTLNADYQHDLNSYIYALPVEGTLYPTENGKIDVGFNQGVKGFDKYENHRYTLGYDIEHQINPDLDIKHSLQYMNAEIDFHYASYDDLVDGSKTLYTRSAQDRLDKSEQLAGNLVASYNWQPSDNIKNVTLFGIDYAKQNHSTERYALTASNLDFFNPDHSQDTVGSERTPYDWSWTTDSKQTGIFVQNQATINDKWVGVLGIRHDKATLIDGKFFFPDQTQGGDYSATTGRAGLVYLMDNGIAPYASINQSFEIVEGSDRNGKLFKPTEGIQFEVGARYQPEGSDTLLTGSLYRIDQTNVLVTDPKDDNFQIQRGKVRSQGLELEAKTKIGDNANLIAAYAYTDARTIEASPLSPEDQGLRTENVPYNKFSLWGDYRFTDFGLPELKIGSGIRYTGSSLGMSDGSLINPSYTLVDAMASYEVNDNWLLSLNVKNLLDEEYVVCSYDCFYGEPRNIVGKVTYKW